MHIFGTTCICYVENKTKLEASGEKDIFVGYDKQSPAYMIYFLETMAIKKLDLIWNGSKSQPKHQRGGGK